MNFPILIVPSKDGSSFRASLGSPFNATVEAPTSHEVEIKAAELIREQFRKGGQLRWISAPAIVAEAVGEDELDREITREWLATIQENRQKFDEAERRRIEEEDAERSRTAS